MGLFDFYINKRQLNRIETLLNLLVNQGNVYMTLLDDIAAAEDSVLAKINANTDALSAVKAALDAQVAKIAELTADLANAGVDQTKLQAVLDKANAILAATDTQAAAEAALTNTPAAPVADVPVEPAPVEPVV